MRCGKPYVVLSKMVGMSITSAMVYRLKKSRAKTSVEFWMKSIYCYAAIIKKTISVLCMWMTLRPRV